MLVFRIVIPAAQEREGERGGWRGWVAAIAGGGGGEQGIDVHRQAYAWQGGRA